MSEDIRHIDEIIETLQKKEKELRELGQEIRSSATPLVIVFIDLAESTLIKQAVEPEEWLGYVYSFIRSVDQLTQQTGGTVVKRIGDELMLTFSNVENSEKFLEAVISDTSLSKFRYKVALDYGEVFLFKFRPELSNDPYGLVVDRCSRIAKLAGSSSALCSSDYLRAVQKKELYYLAGECNIKGFKELQKIYIRPLATGIPDSYQAPLIKALEKSTEDRSGYKYIPRQFSASFFRSLVKSDARPFIAAELLNVPKLPLSPQQLEKIIKEADDGLSKAAEFYGYFVEWKGIYNKYKRENGYLSVTLDIEGNKFYKEIELKLPNTMLEIIKDLKKGQQLRFRGIIEQFFFTFYLNYVEIQEIYD